MTCLWRRGKTCYLRYYVGKRQRAVCLYTKSYPVAMEKVLAVDGAPDLLAMVATPIFAGMRREEAIWLTLDDVDLRGGSQCVEQEMQGSYARTSISSSSFTFSLG